jgi:membrane-bound lytic murein transglycosylase B
MGVSMRALALGALTMLAALPATAQRRETPPPQPDPAFVAWRTDFQQRMIREGFDPTLVRNTIGSLVPDPRVTALNERQAEFSRPVWEYLGLAITPQRIQRGRAERASRQALMRALEAAHGVDPDVVLAIWGIESSFGANTGTMDVPRSLATLAWRGRRAAFAEAELRAVLEMLRRGYATRSQLRGSWAGAMGQTQFIPSTYLRDAVDWNGDGRRNIWTDPDEALASTANFLRQHGWIRGLAPLEEVRLPEGFDYALADRSLRPLGFWAQEAGVRTLAGDIPATARIGPTARLMLPAGRAGPAFLAGANFSAILEYNRSDSYALAVTLLSRALRGEAGVRTPWPRDLVTLQPQEVRTLQGALVRLGYDIGEVDGIAGARTRLALQNFQRSQGLPADGFPTRELLNRVLAAAAAR